MCAQKPRSFPYFQGNGATFLVLQDPVVRVKFNPGRLQFKRDPEVAVGLIDRKFVNFLTITGRY
jgi:hypothetical protein